MVHDLHVHNHGLYLSVQPILSEDTQSLEDLTAQVTELLPEHPENHVYLQALVSPSARPAVQRQRLSALLCALSLMEEILGEIPPALRLLRDDHGRPFAGSGTATPLPFDFNLSHTDGYVACGLLLGGGRLGVDLEPIMDKSRAQKLSPRFFSSGEQACLTSVPEDRLSEEATRIWTAKEALAKQDGRGFPPGFDSTAYAPGLMLYHGKISGSSASAETVLLTVCAPRTCPPPRLSDRSRAVLWQSSL